MNLRDQHQNVPCCFHGIIAETADSPEFIISGIKRNREEMEKNDQDGKWRFHFI
jgi:hypothetical protein